MYFYLKILLRTSLEFILKFISRLVFSAVYEGGGLVWDLKDQNKIKISSGIYLVFILSEDGSKKLIEKILVI